MKRIRTLTDAPPGLVIYRALEGDAANWQRFRSHEAGAAYRDLREELADLQHRLCAYCEAVLIDGNVQVEHVVPQARGRVLDPTNMMVCCLGGTKDVADEDRYLPPVNDNMSCGQAKSGQTDPDFFDPRTLPALPSLVRVRYTGEIEADSNACMATGVPADHVRNTIGMLGLNVRRLQRARQQRWSDLLASFGGLENPDWVTAAARQELALDQRGHLPAFFTTARSFFGLVAEAVVGEPPQAWI